MMFSLAVNGRYWAFSYSPSPYGNIGATVNDGRFWLCTLLCTVLSIMPPILRKFWRQQYGAPWAVEYAREIEVLRDRSTLGVLRCFEPLQDHPSYTFKSDGEYYKPDCTCFDFFPQEPPLRPFGDDYVLPV